MFGWPQAVGVRGSQYLSIRYTERLAEAGIERSVGSVGDSDGWPDRVHCRAVQDGGDSSARAMARQEAVECATLEWVDWFNHRRLLEIIGNRPPAEAEAAYHRQRGHAALAT